MPAAAATGETGPVLLREEETAAYPIVSGIPMLLAPEILGDSQHPRTFDLYSCVLDIARSCARGAGALRLQIQGRVGRRVVRYPRLSRRGGHRDGAWKQYRGCRYRQNKKFPVHGAAPVHSKFASPCCARSAAARCQRSSASSRGLSVGCRIMRSLSQEFLRRRPTCLYL